MVNAVRAIYAGEAVLQALRKGWLGLDDLALSGKLGITGMRERARLIGGTLIVQPELGVGTTVTLRIPS